MNATRHGTLDTFARLTCLLIGVVAVASAIEAALLLARVAEIQRAPGLLGRFRLATEGGEFIGALAIVISVVSVAVLGGWLAWQYRATSLLLAGSTPSRYRPEWSVLWWLVPVADLWMPGVTNADLWRSSHRSAGRPAASWPVWVWWIVLLVGWIAHGAGQVVRQVVLGTSAVWIERPGPLLFSPEEVVTGVRVGSAIAAGGALVLAAAGPLAIHVLSRVTRRIGELVPSSAPVRPDV